MIVEDPQEYMRRFQNNRRLDSFNHYFKSWLITTVLTGFYLLIMIVLLWIGGHQEWGYYMSSIILTEIIIKSLVLAYETAMVMSMKYSTIWMKVYIVSVPIILISIFVWNLVILIDFWLSIKNCTNKNWVLLSASICMVVQSIIWFFVCCFLRCLLKLESMVTSNNNNNRIKKQMDESDLKHLFKTLSELKKIEANENNYTVDVDEWCICLEVLRNDTHNIVLPCHKNHCMHYNCIARWIISDSRCPMCKESITLESVEGKIEEMEKLKQGEVNAENQA